MTNFVQNIGAAKDLRDELIAAGRTPFVRTRSDTFSALHEAPAGLLVPLDSDGWEI
jgi:hypothetical protein